MKAVLLDPWWRSPGSSQWALLIRFSLAGVFLLEGLQKLLFPDLLGSGRFAAIGIPLPSLTGPLVGLFELVCGALLLLGLFSRYAAVPLIIIMLVAILSTKIPILLGTDWLIFKVRELDRYGFWSFAHETRTDWAMLMGALYVLLAGPGPWSLDRWWFNRH